MGIPDNIAVKAELLSRGIADENTKFIINHFSHNGHLLFDELETEAKKHGLTPSFDGMKVEF